MRARFIEDGKLLIAIVKDYWAGAYRQVPYGVIASSDATTHAHDATTIDRLVDAPDDAHENDHVAADHEEPLALRQLDALRAEVAPSATRAA